MAVTDAGDKKQNKAVDDKEGRRFRKVTHSLLNQCL